MHTIPKTLVVWIRGYIADSESMQGVTIDHCRVIVIESFCTALKISPLIPTPHYFCTLIIDVAFRFGVSPQFHPSTNISCRLDNETTRNQLGGTSFVTRRIPRLQMGPQLDHLTLLFEHTFIGSH